MTRLYKYFFRGLITVLPLALTIYLLYLFLAWTEGVALTFLRPFIGGFYVPGMGLALGILGILAIGYLVSKQRVQRVLTLVEMPFTNLPVVKSIYSSLKSFADYFSPSSKNTAQQVVVLRIPGQQLELVGLVTRRGTDGLPEGFTQGERVAVYLPMGYMIGGYTVFVPQEWVQPIQMSVEEAMRSSLIAWMARAENGNNRPVPPAGPQAPVEAPAEAPAAAPAATSPANPAAPANPGNPGNGPA
ncbi:DUF502 domain-containing protein [Achromobacter mucicolens]|uniref:DUF502 domain-containing protein n=1 Tax=Achromobacter mucicolens TaxID=1389922 RepID=UPI001CBC117A|nr:DUF502 domain-containing protein [Achromobacter mucicolens]UAN03896.1 DUF502 domain-containing protein [Achromobacter mucicolens]